MRLADAIRRINRNSYVPAEDPDIGSSFGGGFYVGRYYVDGVVYWLVFADKSSERTSLVWSTASTNDGATSVYDGLANTNLINNSAHPAAQYCRSYVDGLGNSDYYMPSSNELELLYRTLKPDTTSNTLAQTAALNANSVPPRTTSYTASLPARTDILDFRTGGSQAVPAGSAAMMSSTELGSGAYNSRLFSSGAMQSSGKTTTSAGFVVRPVRRIAIPVRPDPDIGSSFGGGFYFGKYNILNTLYWLVISDKSAEAAFAWKTSTVADSANNSSSDGLSNTVAYNNSAHPAAQYVSGYTDSVGNNDYYIWSRNESELAYRNLKPGTDSNSTTGGTGVNPDSVPPGIQYTATDPGQTSVARFKSGGDQALIVGTTTATSYLTSTRVSANVLVLSMATGSPLQSAMTNTAPTTRPIRRVPVS